jgi:hypothetical protein
MDLSNYVLDFLILTINSGWFWSHLMNLIFIIELFLIFLSQHCHVSLFFSNLETLKVHLEKNFVILKHFLGTKFHISN